MPTVLPDRGQSDGRYDLLPRAVRRRQPNRGSGLAGGEWEGAVGRLLPARQRPDEPGHPERTITFDWPLVQRGTARARAVHDRQTGYTRVGGRGTAQGR